MFKTHVARILKCALQLGLISKCLRSAPDISHAKACSREGKAPEKGYYKEESDQLVSTCIEVRKCSNRFKLQQGKFRLDPKNFLTMRVVKYWYKETESVKSPSFGS